MGKNYLLGVSLCLIAVLSWGGYVSDHGTGFEDHGSVQLYFV